VHRWSILITVQRDATQSSLFIILQVHSTCFGCQPHPSSGVHKTVITAPGTGHIVCAATSLQRGQASLEAVVTVLCTPDDGRDWHPKYVEWTCRTINRQLCVASRWTTINIGMSILHSPFCACLVCSGTALHIACKSSTCVKFEVGLHFEVWSCKISDGYEVTRKAPTAIA